MGSILFSENIRAEWQGGFLGERLEVCGNKMIPHMWTILKDSEISHCWQNFLIAAGEAEGQHSGPPFHDGDFYKWLEAAARIYGESSDNTWNEQINSIIEIIARVQRDDGYIFTYDAIQRRNGGTVTALSNDLNFEVYNMGHLMSAGCVHYRTSGKRNLLNLAEKAASYLTKQFADLNDSTARTAICPSHYMGLAQLYETTHKAEYMELLDRLIKLRDSVPEGTDDNQDRIPLKQHREILGHAVRANYLYAGLADLYGNKKDDEYRVVLESVWTDLVSRKIYITGGCGALYDGVSPYGCDDYNYIQRTHQSYGRAYELPNTNGYNESCAAIGFYLWNYRMSETLGDGKYADYMERALYNTVFAAINLEGDRYFYTNALRCTDKQTAPLKWSRHRESYLTSFCCPPNVVRTIAETADHMCIEKDKGLALLLYGSSRIDMNLSGGERCTLNIQTDYPWDGLINIEVKSITGESQFPIFLRIPEWTEDYSVELNGKIFDQKNQTQNGFIRLSKNWKAGDKISLELKMEIRILESNPMVEESRNQGAIMRGPVVYCLETADIPKKCNVSEMYLNPESRFTAIKKTIGSSEMTVLKGELFHASGDEWTGEGLYRNRCKKEYSNIPVQLVPYYAWDNREEGDMTVWLPLLS